MSLQVSECRPRKTYCEPLALRCLPALPCHPLPRKDGAPASAVVGSTKYLAYLLLEAISTLNFDLRDLLKVNP